MNKIYESVSVFKLSKFYYYYYYLKLYSARMVELAVLHTWLVIDECTDGPQTTCACGLL